MIAGVLGFLGSKLAGYAAAIGGVILVLGIVYNAGVNSERKRGEAASLRAQIAIKEKDLAIARTSEQEAAQRAKSLEGEAAKNQRLLNELREANRKKPKDQQCVLSDDDARRLRNIR